MRTPTTTSRSAAIRYALNGLLAAAALAIFSTLFMLGMPGGYWAVLATAALFAAAALVLAFASNPPSWKRWTALILTALSVGMCGGDYLSGRAYHTDLQKKIAAFHAAQLNATTTAPTTRP